MTGHLRPKLAQQQTGRERNARRKRERYGENLKGLGRLVAREGGSRSFSWDREEELKDLAFAESSWDACRLRRVLVSREREFSGSTAGLWTGVTICTKILLRFGCNLVDGDGLVRIASSSTKAATVPT